VGLWIRLKIVETPEFRRTLDRDERVRIPLASVVREHTRTLVLATLAAVTTFVVFYLMTVFTLSWGTSRLGFTRQEFLLLQIVGVLFFAATVPLSAVLAERHGRRALLIASSVASIVFGFAFGGLFAGGALQVGIFLALGLALMGFTYGPLGTALSELFPTAVRYTGASVAFNLAGILGGSLAPYAATWLARDYGIAYVGYYLSAAGAITLVAMLLLAPQRATDGKLALAPAAEK
jgi:MFS family permease